MKRGRTCYLQTVVENDVTKGMFKELEKERYWRIVEVIGPSMGGFEFKRVLLEFDSATKKKRFIREYSSNGRVLGRNTFSVRMSPWKDIPRCRLKSKEELEVVEEQGE